MRNAQTRINSTSLSLKNMRSDFWSRKVRRSGATDRSRASRIDFQQTQTKLPRASPSENTTRTYLPTHYGCSRLHTCVREDSLSRQLHLRTRWWSVSLLSALPQKSVSPLKSWKQRSGSFGLWKKNPRLILDSGWMTKINIHDWTPIIFDKVNWCIFS